jgi:hypothetical protein
MVSAEDCNVKNYIGEALPFDDILKVEKTKGGQ